VTKKSIDWSKFKIDKSKEKNPPQEDDMDEKEVQALIDKSKQEAIDISNKQINMLKEEIEKISGEKPPGGNSMPMDPELKLINKSNF